MYQEPSKDIDIMVTVTSNMYIYKQMRKVILRSIKCSEENGITGCGCEKPLESIKVGE